MLVDQLNNIYEDITKLFTYQPNDEKVKELANTWEPDVSLKPATLGEVRFTGICESFARVAMARCTMKGIKARLVVCYDELKEGHCITEASDDHETLAYYFDNRQDKLVTRDKLVNYQFLGVSPWNPVPGDERPWFLVTP